MKIYEAINLVNIYGADTTLKEVLKVVQGKFIHKCPKCKGRGYIVEEYNAYPSGLPDSGFVYQAGYRDIPCEVCNEIGWTEEEMIPVMSVSGYEVSSGGVSNE